MKICAACHEHLPKESSKKQWKLDECQRRCKVCIANNREIPKQLLDANTKEVIKTLHSMSLEKQISDEELFKQPPPAEDCPICFLLLPSLASGSKYMSCCGKLICSGCVHAPVHDNQGNKVAEKKCAFCRALRLTTNGEAIRRMKKRVEADDAKAMNNLGAYHITGRHGFKRDYAKALELWYRSAELGYAEAYNNIGHSYYNGKGVEIDDKKANHYYKLAVMKGNVKARYNLGVREEIAGNTKRALKHYMISVRGGYNPSLERIKQLYTNKQATKEDYTKALQSYQMYLSEIKSPQRDKAAAFSDQYRYY